MSCEPVAMVADGLTLETLLEMLDAFVDQRPGLEFANYGDVSAYRSDQRAVAHDRSDAKQMMSELRHRLLWRNRTFTVPSGPTTTEHQRLADHLRANLQSGERLHLEQTPDGRAWALSYDAGQYWCTEYRAAVCRLLARALMFYMRQEAVVDSDMQLRDLAATSLVRERLKNLSNHRMSRACVRRWLV